MPSALMRPDQREQLLDQQRRQTERRLVEDQQPRLGHQSASDGEHLLLAAGQRAGALALPLGEPRENREHALAVAARGARGRGDRQPRSRFSRTVMIGKDAAAFRHVDQPARDNRGRALALDRTVQEADRAAPGAQTPEIVRLSVDFPAPFEPSTATISPALTARSMPRRISVAP